MSILHHYCVADLTAISVDPKNKQPARVATAACSGCGTCGAECPLGAITANHYTDAQIKGQIDTMPEENPRDKILAFACDWSSYAGVSRLQYPPNARLIRTMCSGRVDERFIWHGFEKGAPVILVSGCHIGDCHYIDANHWTEKRIEKMRKKIDDHRHQQDGFMHAGIRATMADHTAGYAAFTTVSAYEHTAGN